MRASLPSGGDPGRASEKGRLAELDLAAGADAWLDSLDQPWLPRVRERVPQRSLPRADCQDAHPGDDRPLVRGSPLPAPRLRRATGEPTRRRRPLLHRVLQRLARLSGPLGDGRRGGSRASVLASPGARAAAGGGRLSRRASSCAASRSSGLVRVGATAQQHYADLESALKEWRQGTDEIAAAKREAPTRSSSSPTSDWSRRPSRRCARSPSGSDRLVSVAARTHLQSAPGPANSSYDTPAGGVRTESLERWRAELEDAERSEIEQRELLGGTRRRASSPAVGEPRSPRMAAGTAGPRPESLDEAREWSPDLGVTTDGGSFLVTFRYARVD